jgi:hypothetical protein
MHLLERKKVFFERRWREKNYGMESCGRHNDIDISTIRPSKWKRLLCGS